MSNKLPRYSLYNFFRLSFFLNVCLSVFVICLVFYHRSHINNLKSAITVLTAYNSTLDNDFRRSINFITNEYFSAASSFASNVLFSASVSSSPAFLSPPAASLGSSSPLVTNTPLPSLRFHTYFEANNVPCCYLKRRVYRAGDLLLGYPITEISPDAVEYRGQFFPIEEINK